MTPMRRIRVFFWIFRDLIFRYKRFLLAGFIIGLFTTLVVGRLAPLFYRTVFRPVQRIGIIGDYSLTKPPKQILNDISIGLITLGETGKPEGGAAESWKIADNGKTFIFTLRNLAWHNGKPFVAKDVNYNIQGVTFTPQSDKTLLATLPEPFSPFPVIVSKPLLSAGLVGLGPYKVKTVRLKGSQLESVLVTPVNNFLLPEKEYRIYQTENQAILAYKHGDIDSVLDLSGAQAFTSWPQTTVISRVDHRQYLALFLNTKESELGDRSMRQALAYATPDFEQEDQAYSPIPRVSWAYNDQVRKFAFDPQQAKKMFTALKVASDSALTISTFQQNAGVAKIIADSWTAAGMPTKIRIVNFIDRTFEVFLKVQEVPLDPDQYALWHSKQADTNLTGYVNLKVDKLLEDGRHEIDEEKRKKIYVDFQRFLVEDAPAIFLYYPKLYSIERKR